MKIFDSFDPLKALALSAATFATIFSFLNSPNIDLFFSAYFAGMASGVAFSLFLDDLE